MYKEIRNYPVEVNVFERPMPIFRHKFEVVSYHFEPADRDYSQSGRTSADEILTMQLQLSTRESYVYGKFNIHYSYDTYFGSGGIMTDGMDIDIHISFSSIPKFELSLPNRIWKRDILAFLLVYIEESILKTEGGAMKLIQRILSNCSNNLRREAIHQYLNGISINEDKLSDIICIKCLIKICAKQDIETAEKLLHDHHLPSEICVQCHQTFNPDDKEENDDDDGDDDDDDDDGGDDNDGDGDGDDDA